MNSIFNTLQLNILNIERCTVDQSWDYKDVCSPFFRIFHILNGEGYIYHHKEKHKLVPGKLYLVPSYTNCSYLCEDRLEMIYVHFIDQLNLEMRMYYFHEFVFEIACEAFDGELFFRLLKLNPDKELMNRDPQQYDNWNYLDQQLKYEKAQSFRNRLESQGILLQLFSRFITDEENKLKRETTSHVGILQAIQYIHENLDQKLTVDLLAEKVFLSPDYFSKLFLKTTKCRPIEYIQRKRIEKAQLLLVTTNYPLEKIAILTGLNNASYLTRLFKRYTQKCPGEYRKSRFV